MPSNETKRELLHSDCASLQAAITVALIMTPRSAFKKISESDTVHDARRHLPRDIDVFPVFSDPEIGNSPNEIVGLVAWNAINRSSPTERIAAIMDEDIADRFFAPTSSIIDFARRAERGELFFVGTENEAVGLITLSDLERLPVRTALFNHLLLFEEILGNCIRCFAPDHTKWDEMTNFNKDLRIAEGVARALTRNHIGDPVLGISLAAKLALVEAVPVCKPALRIRLRDLTDVRNAIAHGQPFERIYAIPKHVRSIDRLVDSLQSLLDRHSTAGNDR